MLISFPGGVLVHPPVTVQMVRRSGSWSRAVETKVKIGGSKVGDGVRVGTLSSALIAGHAPASAIGSRSAI